MNINRRHVVLPALAIGLLGVVLALAASAEEDAVAKKVEAFRVAQFTADAKAFDALCAAELSYSTPMAMSRTRRPSSPMPPAANRSICHLNTWTLKFVWSVPQRLCGSTGCPRASQSPMASEVKPISIF
jgi:hypothetical protein